MYPTYSDHRRLLVTEPSLSHELITTEQATWDHTLQMNIQRNIYVIFIICVQDNVAIFTWKVECRNEYFRKIDSAVDPYCLSVRKCNPCYWLLAHANMACTEYFRSSWLYIGILIHYFDDVVNKKFSYEILKNIKQVLSILLQKAMI